MKIIIQVLSLLLAMFVLVSCGRLIQHAPVSSDDNGSVSETIVDLRKRGSVIKTEYLGYKDVQIIGYDEISPNAEKLISVRSKNGCYFTLGSYATDYNCYLSSREFGEVSKEIDSIYMKVKVTDLASISAIHSHRETFEDGSTEVYSGRSGFTMARVTVTGFIDAPGYDIEAPFDALVGKELAVNFGSPWYYDESGKQIRYFGERYPGTRGKYSEDATEYSYVPKVGEEIIICLSRTAARKDSQFHKIPASKVLAESNEAIKNYELITTNKVIPGDDVLFALVNYPTYYRTSPYQYETYGSLTLCCSTFYPAVDLDGNEIYSQEKFERYLYSLDEYFRKKEGLEEPWCNGYYGTLMPPEINDILRDICI